MKEFQNRFGAYIELRNVGANAVAAKVSFSSRLNRFDGFFLAQNLLQRILPENVLRFHLYDGSFILAGCDDAVFLGNDCVERRSFDLNPIVGNIELEDGEFHKVVVSLRQSDSYRCDYSCADTRFIVLHGTISVEVQDDEKGEC